MNKKKLPLIVVNIIFGLLIMIFDYLFLSSYLAKAEKGVYVTYKIIASLGFVLMNIFNIVYTKLVFNKKYKHWFIYFLLAAQIVVFIADVILEYNFMLGAIVFAVGHLVFLTSFISLERFKIRDVICMLLFSVPAVLTVIFYPYLAAGDMFIVLIAYAIIIGSMVGKAFSNVLSNLNRPLKIGVFVGVLMFFMSDMMLLFANFTDRNIISFETIKIFKYLCLFLYYPSNIVLAICAGVSIITNNNRIEGMSDGRRLWCRIYQLCFKIALPLLPYRKPKLIEGVENIPSVLLGKKLNKVIIITDKSIINLGLADNLINSLKENGLEYVIYDGTVPNPTIDCIEEAKELYLVNECEGIIALGGGSAMDLAKIVGARIVKPRQSVSQMKGLLHIRKRLPLLIAIPTTAGTGSETTIAAVITDSKTHDKYPINDFSLIPHYAVLDYKLTVGLPKGLTSTTGMDALTHAVEAFIGNTRTPETKKMSITAVKLIKENLYECYINPTNPVARQNMLLASHYAGIAFTKSYVGYVHAIAHSLGGKYGIPHGLANAVILPVVLKEFGSKAHKKLAHLAYEAQIADINDSVEVAANKFIEWTLEMNAKMGIPTGFEQIKEEDINEMSGKADKEGNPLYPVPVLYNQEQLGEIYRKLIL